MVEFNFTYRTRNEFDESITFSLEGISGVSVSFDPPTATTDTTSVVLRLSGLSEQHLGETLFNLRLTSENKFFAQPLHLELYNAVPTTITLTSPENEMTSFRFPYHFSWETSNSSTYTLEIATDQNFDNTIVNEQILGTNYVTKQLNYATTYYWRVQGENSCGEGAFSTIQTFTTQGENDFKTYVPDDAFEQALINLGYDEKLDDYVVTDYIKDIERLVLNEMDISDVTGIENFAQLKRLTMRQNNLKEINLSKNINLEYLDLDENQLQSIDLPHDSNLRTLWLAQNQLQEIDLSLLEELTFLSIENNVLNCINLEKNKKIQTLYLMNNQLEGLNLDHHKDLKTLYAWNNELRYLSLKNGVDELPEYLDVGSNPNLTCIAVDDPQAALSNAGWLKDSNASYALDCGSTSLDVDGDGVVFSEDLCPCTAAGTQVNASGCAGYQLDSDDDGVSDDIDQCSNTLEGSEVNADGCALYQLDGDDDGVSDDIDQCPDTLEGNEVNANGCALYQLDSDNDGVNDAKDLYSNTPDNTTVDINGGVVINSNKLSFTAYSASCPETASGKIVFSHESTYNFDLVIQGEDYTKKVTDINSNADVVIDQLEAGTYQVKLSFTKNYGAPLQGIELKINPAQQLNASKKSVSPKKKEVNYRVSGAEIYHIYVNGRHQKTIFTDGTNEHSIAVALENGNNKIEITSDKTCQKNFIDNLYITEGIFIYPNPTNSDLFIEGAEGLIQLFNFNGKLIFEIQAQEKSYIDMSPYSSGTYLLKARNLNNVIEIKHLLKQ